ncbi:MAG: hypothetical protein IJK73_04850 [Bacteroidales bacterium]|nr:hypothetical protein [Bacteroidales bacterium]
MKKFVCIAFLIVLPYLVAEAEIRTKKTGKILSVEFYIPKDSTALFENEEPVTWPYIENDIRKVVEEVARQKCKTLIFYDKEGKIFKAFKGKDQLTIKFINYSIESLECTKYIQGEVIGKKTVQKNSAKYRMDTYLNGKLYDTYESDWTSGWFAPTTSTYKSEGHTFVTKTYYLAPSSETIEVRAPGKYVKTEGYTIFAESVYRLE